MSKFTAVIATTVMAALGLGAAASMPEDTKLVEKWKDRSFFSLKSTSLDGKPVDLKDYEGKVVVVVNVASKCGLTPQYEGLEKLYRELKDKDLVVIGFPSNDFGNQEPGTAEEIQSFCSTKYSVTFPMMAKVQTKSGEGQAEIYEFLGTRTGKLPGWNFSKYLIGRDGKTVTFFDSKTRPDAKELREAIDQALAAKPAVPASDAPKVPAAGSGSR